jgi:phenylacetate-CoA ligase
MFPPLFPSFVRNVIYPVYRGFRKDRVLEILEDLEHVQWLSSDEIEELCWGRLESLLKSAVTHVPYYHDLFGEAGLEVDGIQNPADFRKIPLLSKEKIRKAGRRLITRDPLRKGYSSSTGGSTGEPLYFYLDSSVGPLRRANGFRAYRWSGVDIGDRRAHLWGYHLDMSTRERMVEGIKNYFNNIIFLSTFDMSQESMNGYVAKLRRFKPELVVGYPSALTVFSEFCRSGRRRIPQPKAVVTSGERLYAHQREIIEEAFASPVFDRYGSREFANVANECEEHHGLHVFSDLFYTEVIHESGRPAQSGEVGELVVTDLFNLYMPFIRYRTGDLAVPTEDKCPCGRGLPILDRIEGRTFDAVVTPGGKTVGGFFWTWLSRAVPGISQFQIEQRDRSGITFKIVPGDDWKDEFKGELESRIKENCGEGFHVRFMIVDEIPLARSGKSKFIVSNIEERLVIKSKIHKATISGEDPDNVDCLILDGELMKLSNIASGEKVLIVDNTNGSRIETFVIEGAQGSGQAVVGGAGTKLVHAGDEVSIMAFTWSEDSHRDFKNILVDGENMFVRFLTEIAGEKL